MKARKLLENAALGPDQLAVLFQVFDKVWESIKGQYDHTPQATEVGRLRLANALLAAYRDGATKPEQLIATALRAMTRPT
jgi:hypothetical protein